MMTQADILYRAFLDYRKQTEEDSKCQKLRNATRAAGADADKLEAIRSHCIIEEDWVNEIYKGLPFVEKAIREERQFIRQEGEVVPIEKARRVSKSSVEHLARHSDMITHVPPDEEEDLIPDKIYMVERLSDYAVYENRFLYMLLCYLRDFIDIRYTKIVELGNTYHANMAMDKTVKLNKRTLKFDEEEKSDPFDFYQDDGDILMKKIEEERHIISALLLTPIMRMVAKSPMLKPPITRTNAMRMDNNFKNALALYDYVAAYTGDGYRIETHKKTYSPFNEKMGDEIAELVSLTSFLVYQYGKDLKAALRESYEKEEKIRHIEAEQRRAVKLRELKKRIEENGESPDEYMLLLEKQNRELEADCRKMATLESEIEGLEKSIREHLKKQNELRDEIDSLHEENAAKDNEIIELGERHEKEKAQLIDDCNDRLEKQKEENERELAELSERHSAAVNEMREDFDNRMTAAKEEFDSKMSVAEADFAEKYNASEEEKKRFGAECERLSEERTLLKAELHAQKQINGSIVEEGDFTSRDRFTELEREYDAIKKLVEAEWKKTKKSALINL